MPAAVLYRMSLLGRSCPFGIKARSLLESHGYTTEDHVLTTREAVDAFEAEHGVDTTLQVFIDGRRIGGSDALEASLLRSVH